MVKRSLRRMVARRRSGRSLVVHFILLSMSSAVPALAANWQWAPAQTILVLYPEGTGYIFIPSVTTNPNNACPTYFLLSTSDSNYSAKVATLIAAFAASKSVSFVYDASATTCGTPVDRFQVLQ